MKRVGSVKRGFVARRRAVARNFAEYLSRTPKPARGSLVKMRLIIRAVLPRDATEVISYRIPAFRYNERIAVWFAAFSDHCSLFPTAAVVAAFEDELKGFSTSKGTIHFPLDKSLPVALIRKIVKARAKQLEGK